MTPRQAVVQFARLSAMWPQLGGVDDAAESRATEWLRVMVRYDAVDGMHATDELIEDWTGAYPPNVGHWRDVVRSVVRRHPAPPQQAVSGPPVDRERVDALVREATAHLTEQRARAAPPIGLRSPVEPRPPSRHLLSYDEVYGPTQEEPDGQTDDHRPVDP